MADEFTLYFQRFPETPVAGKRLGWHRLHDSRSDAYQFRAVRAVPVVSKEWPRHIPILDQGNLGSCTGNAMTGAAGTDPLWPALPSGHVTLDEREAIALYSAATKLDPYPGSYPPTDTGSDSTSVNKAAQQAGLTSGYTHATSAGDVLQALMAGPVTLGIPWYEGFDDPDANGVVSIAGSIRGGHEIVCRRVDITRKLIGPDNSWGTSFGVNGSFWFSFDDLDRLLGEGGDCVCPVPLTAPAPVPVPVPVPPGGDPAVQTFLADTIVESWASSNHHGAARHVASAISALRSAEQGG